MIDKEINDMMNKTMKAGMLKERERIIEKLRICGKTSLVLEDVINLINEEAKE